MPANLTQEYKNAEAAFRKAREPKERLDCLREMLRTIPKHKGTDHLQADIKSRIKQLTEELAGPKKGGERSGPATVIRPEGAAQIALLGPPNTGKSALHAKLTGATTQVGPYPFATQYPQSGMLPYEDIYFQLIDLPPIAREHPIPWIGNTLQQADAALLIVDLGDPECVERVLALHDILAAKRVTLNEHWNNDTDHATGGTGGSADEDEPDEVHDPFALRLPTLLLAAKADLIAAPEEELEVFRELTGLRYPAFSVSVENGHNLERIGAWLFQHLGVVRVYTKTPGHPPEHDRPFTVRRGETVYDVARLVHREMAESLKYARLWGGGQFDGQQVGRDHAVTDGDILELHS